MQTSALRVLVVEDNPMLRANLGAAFADAQFDASFCSDGLSGLEAALACPPDVLVLDVGLPALDGLRVCQRLRDRADRHVPVLMLTARDALDDRLAGFRSGADDYLVKPFAAAELIARCHALSKRNQSGAPYVQRIGSLSIDRRTGRIERGGQVLQVPLTARHLLLALAEAWPRTLTRSELVARIWGDSPPESDPLRTHLYTLRQVLDRPFSEPMLRTVHHVGFRLEADE